MANIKFKIGGVWYSIPTIKGDKGDTGSIADLGGVISSLPAKTTPVDADSLVISDSASSNVAKKLTWLNVKATLKTYFDTLYNNYVHPANHPASIITQDASNRFVTDTEKTTWNSKANGTHSHLTSDVTGLDTALAGKANTSHTHTTANVTGLDTALAGKASTVHTHVISDVTGLQTALDGKSAKSVVENQTLLASAWVGASAPFTLDLAVTGVTATSFQEWLTGLSITSAELLALQNANIQDGGQTTNTITFKAFGTKPTINIPIRVVKRGD